MNDIEKHKILILSATFGDGHKQVAKAISEAVEYTLPSASPIILDIMEWIHPYLYPVSLFVYKRGIKRFPQVYSYLYKKTRVKNSFSTKLNSLFTFGLQTMLEVIQRINPRVVVSTYPFAAGIISKLKEQGLINIPASHNHYRLHRPFLLDSSLYRSLYCWLQSSARPTDFSRDRG